jgi:adenine/guanine phosphoribosyltransferase-like PRPP-binding protein
MSTLILERTETGQTGAIAPVYQLDKRRVNVEPMVEGALSKLPILKMGALRRALSPDNWVGEFPSLKDLPSRRANRGFHTFDSETGSIAIMGGLPDSPVGEYFTPSRRVDRRGFVILRGENYYKSVDKDSGFDEKLEIIHTDLKDGLAVAESTNRKALDPTNYLAFLGVLEYLKLHSLAMFHAITYRERYGDFPEDQNYQRTRAAARGNMVTLTRAFYQSCMGQPFDESFNPKVSAQIVDEAAEYISSSTPRDKVFTLPEASHPLTIMLGSSEAALRHPEANKIIGIPSGGTEAALVTAYMYEFLHGKSPDVVLVPLSLHNVQGGLSQEKIVDLLRRCKIGGEPVLIVDDNSNTGSTLQRTADAALEAGALNVSAHIVELDPSRIEVKAGKFHNGKGYVVNLEHPDFETAMGIVPITRQKGKEVRRRKARKVLKDAHGDGGISPKLLEKQRRRELTRQLAY